MSMDSNRVVAGSSGLLNTGNGTFYYESLGSGEMVILIHAHSVDRRMWDPQFERLAKTYHVIRYDLRGYGLSDLPRTGESFRHADDLLGIMDALYVNKAHLIGLSLGAFVALDFMALYPARVLSAAVAGGAIYNFGGEMDQQDSGDDSQELPNEAFDADAYKVLWMEAMMKDSGLHRELIRPSLWAMISDWSAWQPQFERIIPLVGLSMPLLLKAIEGSIPLAVMIGEEDSEGSRSSSEELLQLWPSAIRINLPEAGHFSSMETPEAFTIAIEQFLRSTRG